MTASDESGQPVPVRSRRRTVRIVLLCAAVVVMLLIAASGFLSGR